MKILITGTSRGIGKATAEQLRLCDHEVREIWGQQECDVGNREAVRLYCQKLKQGGFMPDAVILNAGIFPTDVNETFHRDIFDKTFAVNLGGAINLIEEFLPDMLKVGQGHFVGIASTAAFRPNLRAISYPATKIALALALRGFDLHYRDKGVAFSAVYLGPIATNMFEGKKSALVPKAEDVAKMLAGLLESKKPVVYYPFFSTMLARLLLPFSDKSYIAIRKYLLG